MRLRRWFGLILAALVSLLTLVGTARPSRAQTPTDLLEVSESCVAIGQRFPTLTVWGTGFNQVAQAGGSFSVEWSWGGAPSTTDPATVVPASQTTTASNFTMTFDVTGDSQGLGGFDVIYNNGVSPTLVGAANVDINPTCPTGTASCSTTPGTSALLVSTSGYDPTWAVDFFYQYHLPDQAGPVPGTAAPDGSVHGQFQPAPQSTNANVTARIIQPPSGDFSGQTYFITVAAPVCHDVPFPTTTTAAPRTTTTTGHSTGSTAPATSTTALGPTTSSTLGSSATGTTHAVLAVSPSVGSGGAVVTVTGSGFPPNVPITVSWQPGIGTSTGQTDALGVFTVTLLVFPHDIAGPRQVVTTSPAAAAGFLNELGTSGPPAVAAGEWVFRR